MIGFLLDTNILSEVVHSQGQQRVKDWVAAQNLDSLFLSVVSFGELRKGITILAPGKRRTQLEIWLENDLVELFVGRILPITKIVAERWGVLEGQRQLKGRPIGVADAQIAATALEHSLTVVTRNVKDFDDLGVAILNPWETG